MSTQIRIYDNATPMLDQIALISHHSALAALDKAGMELRDRTREAFRASQWSHWFTYVKDGKRIREQRAGFSEFGKRLNFKKAGPDNMANMITSYLMPDSMTLVVAGKHKTFIPRFYSAEADAGITTPIYGDRVGQVLQGTYEIIRKLNVGGRFSQQTQKYKNTRMGENHQIGADPRYIPRPFIEQGRERAKGRVTEIMTTHLEALIGRQVNRVTVKTIERVS